MPAQFDLPGFDNPPPPQPKRGGSPASPRGERPTQQLFLALFPLARDAARIFEPIDALRRHHRLGGPLLHTDRLHITLHGLGDHAGAVPHRVIDAAMAAAATVAHAPVDIVFDRALSFAGRKAGKNAFVLCGRDTADVSHLGEALGVALKRHGLRSHASSRRHMTMLYDERVIEEHAIEPICWTASEFLLVLSHVGKTQHDWLGCWPLAARSH